MGKCHQQNTNSHLFCVESLFENPRNKKILCTWYFWFTNETPNSLWNIYSIYTFILLFYIRITSLFLMPWQIPPLAPVSRCGAIFMMNVHWSRTSEGSSWKVWNCWMIDRNCSLKGFKTWWPSIFREQSTSVSCLRPSQLTSQSFSRQSPNNTIDVL